MEAIYQVLDPVFVAAIIALTEVLKRFLPKFNHRLITVAASVLVGASAYLGFNYDLVETVINSISGILSASGLYSLLIKPFKTKS
jgi:hypothetical protein